MSELAAVRFGTAPGRWVILATVLGSGMAAIDATVVGIALPSIGRDFQASLEVLQWVVTSYTLSLAALLLLGGSLGDRIGRRKVFMVGVVWFTLASAACALASGPAMLIVTRALQGVGAALLTQAASPSCRPPSWRATAVERWGRGPGSAGWRRRRGRSSGAT